MYLEYSSKHSLIESNPDFEPKIENQGVITWAGITKQSSEIFKIIFNNSFASNPRIGLPSADRFPIPARVLLIFSTILKEGAKTTIWILRTFPPLE